MEEKSSAIEVFALVRNLYLLPRKALIMPRAIIKHWNRLSLVTSTWMPGKSVKIQAANASNQQPDFNMRRIRGKLCDASTVDLLQSERMAEFQR